MYRLCCEWFVKQFAICLGVVVILLLMTSAISCPLWSSVYKCQRVECAFTSPLRNEWGMFVLCCMQCGMSESAVLQCVDVLTRVGI